MDKLLYIEPRLLRDPVPVVDRLTRLMAAALHQGFPTKRWRGYHTCICGARSDNTDYKLSNGMLTNSLCVHYMACHRPEVPPEMIQVVLALTCVEEEPTASEIDGR